MIDFGVARDKLAWMETADELADFFRHEGIKATPGCSDSCAIAVWMQNQTGDKDVRVSHADMWVGCYGEGAFAEHTKAMKQFTVAFDSGAFPDLIKEEFVR